MNYITPEMFVWIDENLSLLKPHLDKQEYQYLLEDIQENGIYVPITICKSNNSELNGVILDGEARYKIGKQLDIPIPYVYREFESIPEAKIWMIRHQLGRRNLKPVQRATLGVECKHAYEEIASERRGISVKEAAKTIDKVNFMSILNKYVDKDGAAHPKKTTKKEVAKLDETNKKASEARKKAWMVKYPEFNVSILVQKLGYEPWEYPTKWAADPRSRGN